MYGHCGEKIDVDHSGNTSNVNTRNVRAGKSMISSTFLTLSESRTETLKPLCKGHCEIVGMFIYKVFPIILKL